MKPTLFEKVPEPVIWQILEISRLSDISHPDNTRLQSGLCPSRFAHSSARSPTSTLERRFRSRPRVSFGSSPRRVRRTTTRAVREWDACRRAHPRRLTGRSSPRRRRSRVEAQAVAGARRGWHVSCCDYIFRGVNARDDGVPRADPEHAGSDPGLEAGVPERAQGKSTGPRADSSRSRPRVAERDTDRKVMVLGVACFFERTERYRLFPARRASSPGGGPPADPSTFRFPPTPRPRTQVLFVMQDTATHAAAKRLLEDIGYEGTSARPIERWFFFRDWATKPSGEDT